jgi:preprotein translocase subunit YajC
LAGADRARFHLTEPGDATGKFIPGTDGVQADRDSEMSVGNLPLLVLLQAPTGGSGLITFLPLIVIMVIFYVMLILPAQRRQKKTNEMLAALKTGDKVLTSGGIYGTIVGLEGEAVQLRIADQVKVKVARSAISGVQPESKE